MLVLSIAICQDKQTVTCSRQTIAAKTIAQDKQLPARSLPSPIPPSLSPVARCCNSYSKLLPIPGYLLVCLFHISVYKINVSYTSKNILCVESPTASKFRAS